MRIAFVIARGDSFGGSSLHVRDMAARLQEDGHHVRVLVGGTPDMEVPQRFKEKNLDFQCIKELQRDIHPWRDLVALLKIRNEIQNFDADIVSTHAAKGGVLGRLACIFTGVPVIYTPHCWPFVDGFRNASIYRALERGLAWISTQIVAVCEDEKDFGLSMNVGTPEKTIAIHNGVVDDIPYSAPSKSTHPDKTVKMVMVGRFEEQKDQTLLLHALASVRSTNWKLTFVGDGPEKQACQNLAEELGISDQTEFAGYSDHVETHLQESDLFVLATKWEGFPRSILEAMRAGLPAIVSDAGGSRESVIDGANGRVVPIGDKEALRNALEEVISQPELRLEMGQESRKLFEKNFTFERMYQRYVRLYERIIRATSEAPHHGLEKQVEVLVANPREVIAGTMDRKTGH